ncbi:MAG TPA: hypothetical protein VFU15_00055, partial [Bacteroidia bacterium]|nr:hypothetical protein [Bacteroidia bacterium]
PTLIYIYFALGVPKAHRAPFFGPRHAFVHKDKNGNDVTDTAYFSIPAFACKTVNNIPFQSATLDHHMYVALFVRPDSIDALLPVLAQDVRLNRSDYKYARFAFFYPGDSAGNAPASAPDFASDLKLGVDTAFTLFVSRAAFDSLHDNAYFVKDASRKNDPWKTYSDAVIVDYRGRIRGYYDIRSASELKKLKEDVNFIYFRDESAETIENSTIEQNRK